MSFETAQWRGRFGDQAILQGPGLLLIGTMVLWLFCLAVGILGLMIPYPRARPPTKPLPPVQAQLMHVELTKTTASPRLSRTVAPRQVSQPQPTPPAPSPPPTPVAVAEPSPSIAFAVPVKGPVSIVPLARAAPNPAPPAAKSLAPAAPQQLIYGKGEGIQPAPEYPLEAIQMHQEGKVVVQFNINESGDVTSARVIQPSPYPLLNESARRAIRETWHFPTGPARSYEVSIVFRLNQQ
jgi:protein TonB